MGKFKRSKSKGGPRKGLKSYKHGGVDKFVMRDNDQVSGGIFRYRDRLKSMGVPEDGQRNHKDYHELPVSKTLSPPLLELVNKADTWYALWQSKNGKQGVNRLVHEVLLKSPLVTLTLFWHASSNTYFFVREKPHVIDRSTVYSSRQLAMRAHGYGQVKWVVKWENRDT